MSIVDCRGKVQFDSYQLAIRIRGRHSRQASGRFDVYKCDSCGKWHIGGRRPGEIKPRRPQTLEAACQTD